MDIHNNIRRNAIPHDSKITVEGSSQPYSSDSLENKSERTQNHDLFRGIRKVLKPVTDPGNRQNQQAHAKGDTKEVTRDMSSRDVSIEPPLLTTQKKSVVDNKKQPVDGTETLIRVVRSTATNGTQPSQSGLQATTEPASATENCRTTASDDIATGASAVTTESVTITPAAAPSLSCQLRQLVAEFSEDSHLIQGKKWLQDYRSMNPDIDTSQLSDAIDLFQNQYQLFVMIKFLWLFSVAIEAPHPEIAKEYKDLAESLINDMSKAFATEPESAGRKKRAIRDFEKLVKLFSEAIEKIEGLDLNNAMRQFSTGLTEASRAFNQGINGLLNGQAFLVSEFISGDVSASEQERATTETTLTRLNDRIASNIDTGDYLEAGRQAFRLHLALDYLGNPTRNGFGDLQAVYQDLFRQSLNAIPSLDVQPATFTPFPSVSDFFSSMSAHVFRRINDPFFLIRLNNNQQQTLSAAMGHLGMRLVVMTTNVYYSAFNNMNAVVFGNAGQYSRMGLQAPFFLHAMAEWWWAYLTAGADAEIRASTSTAFRRYGGRTGSLALQRMATSYLSFLNPESERHSVSNIREGLEQVVRELRRRTPALRGAVSVQLRAHLNMGVSDARDTPSGIITITAGRVLRAFEATTTRTAFSFIFIEDPNFGRYSISVGNVSHLAKVIRRYPRLASHEDRYSLTTGRGARNELVIHTNEQLSELGRLTPLPGSAMTIMDFVANPVAQYQDIEPARVLTLIQQYLMTVVSANVPGMPVNPGFIEDSVTTDDPIVLQMQEVIARVQDTISNGAPLPAETIRLYNHINRILIAARQEIDTLASLTGSHHNPIRIRDAARELFARLPLPFENNPRQDNINARQQLGVIQAMDLDPLAHPSSSGELVSLTLERARLVGSGAARKTPASEPDKEPEAKRGKCDEADKSGTGENQDKWQKRMKKMSIAMTPVKIGKGRLKKCKEKEAAALIEQAKKIMQILEQMFPVAAADPAVIDFTRDVTELQAGSGPAAPLVAQGVSGPAPQASCASTTAPATPVALSLSSALAQILVRLRFSETITALRTLRQNDQDARQFSVGLTTASRMFAAKVHRLLQGQASPINEFLGGDLSSGTRAATLGRLNQLITARITAKDFQSAGRYAFSAAIAMDYLVNDQRPEFGNIDATYRRLFAEELTAIPHTETVTVSPVAPESFTAFSYRSDTFSRMNANSFHQINHPWFLIRLDDGLYMDVHLEGDTLWGLVEVTTSGFYEAPNNLNMAVFGDGRFYSSEFMRSRDLLQSMSLWWRTVEAQRQDPGYVLTEADREAIALFRQQGGRTGSRTLQRMAEQCSPLINLRMSSGLSVPNITEALIQLVKSIRARDPAEQRQFAQLRVGYRDSRGVIIVRSIIRIAVGSLRSLPRSKTQRQLYYVHIDDSYSGRFVLTIPALRNVQSMIRHSAAVRQLEMTHAVDLPGITTAYRLFRHTAQQLTQLGSLPVSAMNIRDMVGYPMDRYWQSYPLRVMKLILNYVSVVSTAEARNIMGRPSAASDEDPVATADPTVFQMQEVLAYLQPDPGTAANAPPLALPARILELHNHITGMLMSEAVRSNIILLTYNARTKNSPRYHEAVAPSVHSIMDGLSIPMERDPLDIDERRQELRNMAAPAPDAQSGQNSNPDGESDTSETGYQCRLQDWQQRLDEYLLHPGFLRLRNSEKLKLPRANDRIACIPKKGTSAYLAKLEELASQIRPFLRNLALVPVPGAPATTPVDTPDIEQENSQKNIQGCTSDFVGQVVDQEECMDQDVAEDPQTQFPQAITNLETCVKDLLPEGAEGTEPDSEQMQKLLADLENLFPEINTSNDALLLPGSDTETAVANPQNPGASQDAQNPGTSRDVQNFGLSLQQAITLTIDTFPNEMGMATQSLTLEEALDLLDGQTPDRAAILLGQQSPIQRAGELNALSPQDAIATINQLQPEAILRVIAALDTELRLHAAQMLARQSARAGTEQVMVQNVIQQLSTQPGIASEVLAAFSVWAVAAAMNREPSDVIASLIVRMNSQWAAVVVVNMNPQRPQRTAAVIIDIAGQDQQAAANIIASMDRQSSVDVIFAIAETNLQVALQIIGQMRLKDRANLIAAMAATNLEATLLIIGQMQLQDRANLIAAMAATNLQATLLIIGPMQLQDGVELIAEMDPRNGATIIAAIAETNVQAAVQLIGPMQLQDRVNLIAAMASTDLQAAVQLIGQMQRQDRVNLIAAMAATNLQAAVQIIGQVQLQDRVNLIAEMDPRNGAAIIAAMAATNLQAAVQLIGQVQLRDRVNLIAAMAQTNVQAAVQLIGQMQHQDGVNLIAEMDPRNGGAAIIAAIAGTDQQKAIDTITAMPVAKAAADLGEMDSHTAASIILKMVEERAKLIINWLEDNYSRLSFVNILSSMMAMDLPRTADFIGQLEQENTNNVIELMEVTTGFTTILTLIDRLPAARRQGAIADITRDRTLVQILDDVLTTMSPASAALVIAQYSATDTQQMFTGNRTVQEIAPVMAELPPQTAGEIMAELYSGLSEQQFRQRVVPVIGALDASQAADILSQIANNITSDILAWLSVDYAGQARDIAALLQAPTTTKAPQKQKNPGAGGSSGTAGGTGNQGAAGQSGSSGSSGSSGNSGNPGGAGTSGGSGNSGNPGISEILAVGLGLGLVPAATITIQSLARRIANKRIAAGKLPKIQEVEQFLKDSLSRKLGRPVSSSDLVPEEEIPLLEQNAMNDESLLYGEDGVVEEIPQFEKDLSGVRNRRPQSNMEVDTEVGTGKRCKRSASGACQKSAPKEETKGETNEENIETKVDEKIETELDGEIGQELEGALEGEVEGGLEGGLEGIGDSFAEGLSEEALELLVEDGLAILPEELTLNAVIGGLAIESMATGIGMVIGGLILIFQESELIDTLMVDLFTDPDQFARDLYQIGLGLDRTYNASKEAWRHHHARYHELDGSTHKRYTAGELLYITGAMSVNMVFEPIGTKVIENSQTPIEVDDPWSADKAVQGRRRKRRSGSVAFKGGSSSEASKIKEKASENPASSETSTVKGNIARRSADNSYVNVHLINRGNNKVKKASIHPELFERLYRNNEIYTLRFVDARPCHSDLTTTPPAPVASNTSQADASVTSNAPQADAPVPIKQPVYELVGQLIKQVRDHLRAGWLGYLQLLAAADEWMSEPEDIGNDYIDILQFFWSDLKIQSKLKAEGFRCDAREMKHSQISLLAKVMKEQVDWAYDHFSSQAMRISDRILRDLNLRSQQLQNHGIDPTGRHSGTVDQPQRDQLLQQMDEVIARVLWARSNYLEQNSIDRKEYNAEAEPAVFDAAGFDPEPENENAITTRPQAPEVEPDHQTFNQLDKPLWDKQEKLEQDLLAELTTMVGSARQHYAGFLQGIRRQSVGNLPEVGVRVEAQDPDLSVYQYAIDGFEVEDIYGVKQARITLMENESGEMNDRALKTVGESITEIREEIVSKTGYQPQTDGPGIINKRYSAHIDKARQQHAVLIRGIEKITEDWRRKVDKKVPPMLPLTQLIPWPETIQKHTVVNKLKEAMQSTRNILSANLINYINSLEFGSSGMVEGVKISPLNIFWKNLNNQMASRIRAIQSGRVLTRQQIGAVMGIYQSAMLDAYNVYSHQARELSRTAVKSLMNRYREFTQIIQEVDKAYSDYQSREQKFKGIDLNQWNPFLVDFFTSAELEELAQRDEKNAELHQLHQQYVRANNNLIWAKQKIATIYEHYAEHIGQQVRDKTLIKDSPRVENTLGIYLEMDLSAVARESAASRPLPANPAAAFFSDERKVWRDRTSQGLREELHKLVNYSLETAYLSFLMDSKHGLLDIGGLDSGPRINGGEAIEQQLHQRVIVLEHTAENRMIRNLEEFTDQLTEMAPSFVSSGKGSLNDIRELIDSETEWANERLSLLSFHGMQQLLRDWEKNVLEIYSDSTGEIVKSFDEYHKIMAGNSPSTETLTTTELTTTRKPSLPKRHHHLRHHKNIPIAPELADYRQPSRQRRSMAGNIDQGTGNLPAETGPGDITSGASSNRRGLLFDAADLSLGLLSRLSDMFSGKPSQEPFQASRVVDQKTGGSDANGAFGANGANSTHDTGGPSGTGDTGGTGSTGSTGGTGVERHVFQVQAYYNGHCQDQDQPSCEPTQSMVAMRGNTREACAVMGKPGESQCMIFSNQPANHAEQSNPDNPGHLPSTKKASLLDALEGNARVAWQQDTGVLQNDLHDLRFPGTTNEPLHALVKRAAELGPLPAGFAPGAPGDNGFTYGHQQTTNLTCNTGMTECTLDREPPLSVISKFKAIVNRARAAANASLLNHWSATAMDFSHNSLELLPALACSLNDRTLVPSRYVDDSRGVFPVKADLPPQPEPTVPPCSTAPSTSTAAASGNPVRPQNRSFSEWLSYLWNYGIRDESSPAGSTGPAITLDQSPGMSLLRDCYCVAEPLHREVIRFIDDLKASGSPDDDWHKDDIIPMAVLWRKGATEAGEVPVNLFLDEVLHSPELGLDHESVHNIFALDGQGELSIRGRHNVFPFDGQGKLRILGRKAGGGLFYQSRQGGAQTGHARELARCMLRAMARQRLPQKMSGKSLDAGIFKRVRQLQGQQQQGQQQPLWEQQEIRDRLKALSRPPQSFPLASAPVLNLLQAGLEKKEPEPEQEEEVVEAAKRKFLELSPGDQLEALEALLKQPDLYGLDCKYEWISAVQEALSSESVSPADSENAWYLLAYQFDIRHGIRREVAGKVKVMDLVRQVAGQADEPVQQALAGLLVNRLPVSATIYEQSLPGNHPRSVALPFQYHDYDESLSVSLINDYEMIKSEIGRQIRESGNVKDTEEDDPLPEKQINELSVYCLQNYLEKQDKGHEPDISAIVMEELELDEKEIEDTAFVD